MWRSRAQKSVRPGPQSEGVLDLWSRESDTALRAEGKRYKKALVLVWAVFGKHERTLKFLAFRAQDRGTAVTAHTASGSSLVLI